jgi:hypothetical protein
MYSITASGVKYRRTLTVANPVDRGQVRIHVSTARIRPWTSGDPVTHFPPAGNNRAHSGLVFLPTGTNRRPTPPDHDHAAVFQTYYPALIYI